MYARSAVNNVNYHTLYRLTLEVLIMFYPLILIVVGKKYTAACLPSIMCKAKLQSGRANDMCSLGSEVISLQRQYKYLALCYRILFLCISI